MYKASTNAANQMFAIKVTMTEPDAIEIFKPGMAAEVVLE